MDGAATTAVNSVTNLLPSSSTESKPIWPEPTRQGGAPSRSRRAETWVELLLSHGHPNGHSDSGGDAVYAARTSEIRTLLEAHGGSLDPYDLVWKDEDEEVIRRVTADPKSAELGCGGVFTAVVTRGKRDLLKRLLDAGIRVPPLVTGCQSYLMEQPDMFRTLLESGMNPDTCNWQMQTMLHLCCRGDGSGRPDKVSLECAAMLLDAGANISARDDDYCSTPLGWAARHNRPDMVDFLLARGAKTNFPDDKPWATPLAWAKRRGNTQVSEMLAGRGRRNEVRRVTFDIPRWQTDCDLSANVASGITINGNQPASPSCIGFIDFHRPVTYGVGRAEARKGAGRARQPNGTVVSAFSNARSDVVNWEICEHVWRPNLSSQTMNVLVREIYVSADMKPTDRSRENTPC